MKARSVLAPAKINLFLCVYSKRDDGYHNVCTVICAVSLYDLLIFSFNKGSKISVVCDNPLVPDNESNLVNKAVRLFFEKLQEIGLEKKLGVNVSVRKKIPVGAGFGGGSSNAASTLMLLNSIFRFPFSKRSLMKVGEKIGADVPFFIFGKPAIAKGVGDKIKAFKFDNSLPRFALLVYTGLAVSTGWVYENLCLYENLRLTRDQKDLSKFHLDANDFNHKHDLLNDLESVTETRYPVIGEVKRLLLSLGAVGVLMSGSGSGVFGLYDSKETAIAAQFFFLRNYWDKGWFTCFAKLLV